MNHSEFGHKLRRICRRGPARRTTRINPAPTGRTVRHDIPPNTSVELLWTGPGPGDDDDV